MLVGAASVCSLMSSPLACLVDADRVLRAVGDRQSRLLLEVRRHRAVADDDGLAVVVDVEQLGRQRVAPVVPLALLGIDPYLHARSVRARRAVATAVHTLPRCRRSSPRRPSGCCCGPSVPMMPSRSPPTAPTRPSPAFRVGP